MQCKLYNEICRYQKSELNKICPNRCGFWPLGPHMFNTTLMVFASLSQKNEYIKCKNIPRRPISEYFDFGQIGMAFWADPRRSTKFVLWCAFWALFWVQNRYMKYEKKYQEYHSLPKCDQIGVGSGARWRAPEAQHKFVLWGALWPLFGLQTLLNKIFKNTKNIRIYKICSIGMEHTQRNFELWGAFWALSCVQKLVYRI